MSTTFRIRPYNDAKRPALKYVVNIGSGGKRTRKFFETKREAETFVQQRNIELLNQGREGVAFPSWLRITAQREHDRLQTFGKTITDAADFFVKHLEATARSAPLSQAMAELIENRRASGASKRYCYDIGLRLARFCADFPDRMAAEITTKDVDDWLARLPLAPVTRNTFRRDVRTLFSFCVTRRYCPSNPVVETRKAKEIDGAVEILSVADTARLLESANFETLPYWAIGSFAGLRRAEVERLEWSEIDFESGFIEVKAAKSKTATRRLVTITPNLREWLAPYRAHIGRVCPVNLQRKINDDRERAGMLEDWPQNALRHSFGSYHLAEFKDAAALALQMGNSPEMIFRHYRELVKPKDAELYWQIKPSEPASEKIVSISAA